ncbi:DUF125-domain-containing protein [Canariomyces notabilis]|uniref:DUF125-domain-containing protein n=1 Tax=Canariomyces notabilis TaxID=2074819 RepID=A0AAN6T9A2_9PEZI|nr:DUF125-domain-containing protein [Canariomyces arenarius]
MSRVWRPVLEKLGLQPLGSRDKHENSLNSFEALPLYSTVNAGEASSPTTTDPFSEIGNDILQSCTSSGYDGSRVQPPPSSSSRGLLRLPTLARFLADFTLGFADGLTVPFALTAGLSSLGHADTVIYAGMAEICAGSISMGIGGYLSARGEVATAAAAKATEDNNIDDVAVIQEEKSLSTDRDISQLGNGQFKQEEASDDERLPSPFMAGLSVALGYLLGGLLPLFPYFLVDQVKDGLLWSFGVCAVALFAFGFCKDFVLTRGNSRHAVAAGEPEKKMRWRDIRRSAWEGAQMVLLGSVAALAAVLCVRAFESLSVSE